MSPYRTAAIVPAEPELTDKQIYELGLAAIEHINRQCPNALIVEAKNISVIEYENKVHHYHYGDMVMKHSIRHMISFPRHWREPCCREPIIDFLEAECLTGWYYWKWRWAKRKRLQIQMFQGVVTEEDFQKLLVELRGLDDLVQDSTYRVRRPRARLYDRARYALLRLRRRRGGPRGPGEAQMGL